MISHSASKKGLKVTNIGPSASITAFMVRCDGNGPVFKMTAHKDFRLAGKKMNIKTREVVADASLFVPALTTLYFVESQELPGWYYVSDGAGCSCPGMHRYQRCKHTGVALEYAAQPRNPRLVEIIPASEPVAEKARNLDQEIAYWRRIVKEDKERQKREKAAYCKKLEAVKAAASAA